MTDTNIIAEQLKDYIYIKCQYSEGAKEYFYRVPPELEKFVHTGMYAIVHNCSNYGSNAFAVAKITGLLPKGSLPSGERSHRFIVSVFNEDKYNSAVRDEQFLVDYLNAKKRESYKRALLQDLSLSQQELKNLGISHTTPEGD